jgi:hypothetical protein
MGEIIFPEVSGKNLKRKKFHFPQDFPTSLNIVLVAFQRHQQLEINTWLPFVSELDSEYSDLTYFEFPVIYQMGPLGQFMLNEGMRAGIPDQKARESTITLYVDKPQFMGHLQIQSEDAIQIFLVTDEGKVLWHETGVISDEKANALIKVVQSKNQKNQSKPLNKLSQSTHA